MDQENLLDLLTLQRIPNLGNSSVKKLIHFVGSAKGVFSEKTNTLLKIPGIGAFKIKELHNTKYRSEAESELRFITKANIQYVSYDQEDYPALLQHCADSPIVLFYRGNISLQNKKIISIVGTREVSRYGIQFCEELVETLSPLDPVIVSGFAYGVDITAHLAAVKNNLQTIACLAHGLNQIYPKQHAKFQQQLESHGGFYSNFWSDDIFDRKNFLSRNRIIAGLSEATVVIESAQKGGSLVTANMAHSYHREVFAVPGRVHDRLSTGCNTLIKTQKAHMLTSAADLIYVLGWDIETNKKPAVQKELLPNLEGDEKKIFNYLKHVGRDTLDTISLQCELPTHRLVGILLHLELQGLVRPLPGKLYEVV